MLTKSKPEQAKLLFKMAQEDVAIRYQFYEYLAARPMKPNGPPDQKTEPVTTKAV